MIARGFFVSREVRRLEETGESEKNRLGVVHLLPQCFQRDSLSDQSEGQFVFFVTERGRDFLKKRFVCAMVVDLCAESGSFFLQAKLRGRVQNAPDAFFR